VLCFSVSPSSVASVETARSIPISHLDFNSTSRSSESRQWVKGPEGELEAGRVFSVVRWAGEKLGNFVVHRGILFKFLPPTFQSISEAKDLRVNYIQSIVISRVSIIREYPFSCSYISRQVQKDIDKSVGVVFGVLRQWFREPELRMLNLIICGTQCWIGSA
jgi:hypothetical protein